MKISVSRLALCLLGLVVLTQASAPSTPYFERLREYMFWLNTFRIDQQELATYVDQQSNIRTLDRTWNGEDAGTYTCWDDWNKLSNQFDDEGSIQKCDFQGLWKHGPETLDNLKTFLDTSVTKRLNGFEWNDELSLSAQDYLTELEGCSMFQPQILNDDNPHDNLDYFATYDDHIRGVFYPERFAWNSPKEAIFDWIVDDTHTDHTWRHHLTENHFDSVGIACNCHVNFGEVCVVELGLHVERKFEEHEHPWVSTDFMEMQKSQRSLFDAKIFPVEWNTVAPTWWKNTTSDWEWLRDNYDNISLMRMREFKLPNDPTCENTLREGFCDNVSFDDQIPNRDSDMETLAANLFNNINAMRNNPQQYRDGLTINDSEDELNTWDTLTDVFQWSEGISSSIRHVLNEEGSCGTFGDSNSNYVTDALKKYYAHSFSGLEFITVTSPNLVTDTGDMAASADFAIDFILSQVDIDKTILRSTNNLRIGVGCACACPTLFGEPAWTCMIGVAHDVCDKVITERLPSGQNIGDYATCKEFCPYLNDRDWNDNFETTCPSGGSLSEDKHGLCSECSWNSIMCADCNGEVCNKCFNEGEFFAPLYKSQHTWENKCIFPGCSDINDDHTECNECQWINYQAMYDSDDAEGILDKIEDGKDDGFHEDRVDRYYLPRNIFHNPIDKRCTSDCSKEDRNFVNPFMYDSTVWDTVIANGLVSPGSYDLPKIDGPYTCVCKEGFGWSEDDKECKDCSEIHYNCIDCSSSETCTECGSFLKMVSPDGSTCVDKITGCQISNDMQPELLREVTGRDGERRWICPDCKEGYFWNYKQNRCTPCSFAIDHCTSCPTGERCISCEDDWFPNYLQDGCQEEIDHCKIDSVSDYRNNGETFICQECDDGWYTDGDKCSKCQIPGCETCVSATECTSCPLPMRKSIDGKTCIEPIPDCYSDPRDYVEDPDNEGDFMCPVCKNNTIWFSVDQCCANCDKTIPFCEKCENGKCLECRPNHSHLPLIPSVKMEACIPHIPLCNATNIPSDYIVRNLKYHCAQCNDGHVWVEEVMMCVPCAVLFDGDCSTCSSNWAGDYFCESCQNGKITNKDKQSCVERLENCSIILTAQPTGLVANPNGEDWMCPSCSPGFFWDDDHCEACVVTGCATCSDEDTCNSCTSIDNMLNPDKTACVPKIDDCNAVKATQPTGLACDVDNNRWFCDDCKDGFFTDKNLQCSPCDVITACLTCKSDESCTTCSSNLLANGNHCDARNIPNCKTENATNALICDECHNFHSLIPDKTQCVPCFLISEGCTECDIHDNNDQPDTCLDCATHMELSGNACVWNICSDVKSIDEERNSMGVAQCLDCVDGYGLNSADSTCVACFATGQLWDDCKDCTIDNNLPLDCLECGNGKVLVSRVDVSLPEDRCELVTLTNCADANPGLTCQDCDNGYYWDGENCRTCGTDQVECHECHVESTNGESWITCDSCASGFKIEESEVTLVADTYTRYTCDWLNSIPHCALSDMTSNTNCLQCDDHFYFNSAANECQLCDTTIDGCSTCTLNGLTCNTCLRNYDFDNAGNCVQTYCTDGSYTPNTGVCTACNDGYFRFTNQAVPGCVTECPTGYWGDVNDNLCRLTCPSTQYSNPDNELACIACPTTNCDVCGPADGIYVTGMTLECFGCVIPLVLTPLNPANSIVESCDHAACATINAANSAICDVCVAGYYMVWDTTECLAPADQLNPTPVCDPELYHVYEQASGEHSVNYCGPICSANQFKHPTTKLCDDCVDTIGSCGLCHMTEDTFEVLCDFCDSGLFLNWNSQGCSACQVTEYTDANSNCAECQSIVANCGRCQGLPSTNTFSCEGCLGDIPFDAGTCGCDFVEFVDQVVSTDIDSKTCSSCLTEIDNCNECAYDSIPTLRCTDCRLPYYVDGNGQCTLEACRTFSATNVCSACNARHGLTYKTQEDTCVVNCHDPYEEISANVCGVNCPVGQKLQAGSTTLCESCAVNNCMYCQDVGVCTHCLFGETCDLECSSTPHIPIHDYGHSTNDEDSKCVSSCYHVNSVASSVAISGFNTPRCRYCGDGCEDCREDSITETLFCALCEGTLLVEDENCVISCTPPRVQVGRFCIGEQ